ncbi:hypothetical protein BH23ACT8_BH23ACT8_15650 [soil metagenome]
MADTTTRPSFPTIADALAAGWRHCLHEDGADDTSGADSYGYRYRSAQGEESVTVWLTDQPNRMGAPGCFLPMFPPRDADAS